jgi:hypothetical protein
MLEALMHDILNVRVQSIHTDISTKTGERVIVFTLEEKLEFSVGNDGAEGHLCHNGNAVKEKKQMSRS